MPERKRAQKKGKGALRLGMQKLLRQCYAIAPPGSSPIHPICD